MACPTVMLQTLLAASLLGAFLLTRMTHGQKLIMRHDTMMAEKGSTVNFSCICDQPTYGFYQRHRIIWRHTGNDVTHDKKLSENGRLEQREQYYRVEFRHLLPLGFASYLIVTDLDESRAGRYSCSLVDEMDKVLDEKIMNLNIGVIPTAANGLDSGMTSGQGLIIREPRVEAKLGKEANLSCMCDQPNYSFFFTHTIQWHRSVVDETTKISDNGNLRVMDKDKYYVAFRKIGDFGFSTNLQIKKIDRKDIGKYWCILVGPDGIIENKTVSLFLKDEREITPVTSPPFRVAITRIPSQRTSPSTKGVVRMPKTSRVISSSTQSATPMKSTRSPTTTPQHTTTKSTLVPTQKHTTTSTTMKSTLVPTLQRVTTPVTIARLFSRLQTQSSQIKSSTTMKLTSTQQHTTTKLTPAKTSPKHTTTPATVTKTTTPKLKMKGKARNRGHSKRQLLVRSSIKPDITPQTVTHERGSTSKQDQRKKKNKKERGSTSKQDQRKKKNKKGQKTQRPIQAGSETRKHTPLTTVTEMFLTKKLTDRILVETVTSVSTNKLYPVDDTTDTSLGATTYIRSPTLQVHIAGSQGSFGWFMTQFRSFLMVFDLLFRWLEVIYNTFKL